MSRRRRGRPAPVENAPALSTPVVPNDSEVTVTIDTSKMKMKDLRLLARLRRGEGGDEEAIEFLNRVVVGGVDELPLAAQPQVWAAVWAEVYGGKRRKN